MAFSDDVHKASQEHHLSKMRGGNLGGAGGYAPPPVKRETTFDQVDEVCAFAHKLASRIETLEDRLLGCRPRGGDGSCQEVADGVLPCMAQRASGARGRLGDAMAALDNIERSLP